MTPHSLVDSGLHLPGLFLRAYCFVYSSALWMEGERSSEISANSRLNGITPQRILLLAVRGSHIQSNVSGRGEMFVQYFSQKTRRGLSP
jgi:hypothetical protein